MKKIEQTIVAWGVLDLFAMAWYLGRNIYQKKLPIAHDVQMLIETSTSFGLPSLVYIGLFGIIIYLSLLLSGVFLIKLNKIGAIISYIQLPFRLVAVIPPSLFFIFWFIPDMSHNPRLMIISSLSLILVCEVIKTSSVVYWHKQLNKNI